MSPIETELTASAPSRGLSSTLHWRRFRRLIAFMLTIAVVAVSTSLWLLHRDGVVLHLPLVIAMGVGITMTLLLAGVLMGLVFLSANSGHDDAVIDPADRGARRDSE